MSDIKTCFTSRFAPAGVLLDADFDQLEIVALAILSNDPVLKEDLLSGKDLHVMRASELFNKPEWIVTKEERTIAKQLSFQLQYGAGAKSMAEKNNIKIELAKKFIMQYYDRYTEVKRWQDDVASIVKESRETTASHTEGGFPKGQGIYKSATGRVYKFFEYDNEWKKEPSFSPTETKNYPVQGFATADIMALFRGRIYRRLLADEELFTFCLIINTVHDSVMFDCSSEYHARRLAVMLKEEAEKLPALIGKLWNIPVDLPLKLECKIGSTWGTLKTIEETE